MTTAEVRGAAVAGRQKGTSRGAVEAGLRPSGDEPADLFVRSTPTMIKSSSNVSSNEVRRRDRMNGTTTAAIHWSCGVTLEMPGTGAKN